MPWCPKCKTEYRTGFFECKDCDFELMEFLQPEVDNTKHVEYPKDLGSASFLISVANELEANLIDSVLKAEGIPTLIKHKDIGAYLNIEMGMSNFGLDIFVPESLVERGKEVIKLEISGVTNKRDNSQKKDDSIAKRRKIALLMIAAVWILPLVLWMVTTLVKKIN